MGDGSGLRELARTGQSAPGGGMFRTLKSHHINGRGEVALTANLGPPFNTFDQNEGLFVGSGQHLQTIVRTGELLPSGGAVFTTIYSSQNTDWGVVFAAGFRPFNGYYETFGLFAWDGRTLFEVARADKGFEGEDVRHWSFRTGLNDFSVNAHGQVAYWMGFSDSSYRVAVWSPPATIVPETASSLLFAASIAGTILRFRYRLPHR
jgi:hypothetical protein